MSPNPADTVAVVVVTYNSADYVKRCIDSVLANDPGYLVVIVDNGSSDSTTEIVDSLAGNIVLLADDRNLGFGEACNRAVDYLTVQHSAIDHVLFLNPDAYLDEDCLSRLFARLQQDPLAAAVCPMIVNHGDGEPTIWYAGSSMVPWSGETPHDLQDVPLRETVSTTLPRFTQRATGGVVLVRAKVFRETGGFDPYYFLYFEDTDLSLRLTHKGYKIAFEQSARAFHEASSSTGGGMSALYHYYMERNRLYTVKKHGLGSPLRVIFARFVIDLMVVRRLRGRQVFVFATTILKAQLCGWFDFYRARGGRQRF